jgi:hypothetical protein
MTREILENESEKDKKKYLKITEENELFFLEVML